MKSKSIRTRATRQRATFGWSANALGRIAHSVESCLRTQICPEQLRPVAGFRGTTCTPKASDAILRIIRDEQDPDIAKAAAARAEYELRVQDLVKKLSPQDFEQLIDLALARSGWTRLSKVGGIREGIDVEVENPAVDEVAFVQVKGSATQSILNDYVMRFTNRREQYDRMIFAVHSPIGRLTCPDNPEVQVWTVHEIAHRVVRLGLGEWIESKLA